MVNVIAGVVAKLVEHDGEAQHDTIFIGVLRHFLIPGTDQIALTLRDVYSFYRSLRTVFANVVR